MIESNRDTGFCHVTLCGRLVEKPIVSDPPLKVDIRCPDGTYQVHACGAEAKALAGASANELLLIRGRAKIYQWKAKETGEHRSRMVVECQSVKVLDGRKEECQSVLK
jgi:hypothetical protein